jgi:RNA polymerase sigma-54 factor
MALSASLQLRQTQSLVMTPQLMQSIQLLQMNHLELGQFIAQELERNPLLEIVSSGEGSSDDFGPGPEHDAGISGAEEPGSYRTDGADQVNRLNEALDGGFDNVYQDDQAPRKADAPELLQQWKSMPGSLGESGESYDLDEFVAGQMTLKDHLNQQIPFLIHGQTQRLIAQYLTDMLDEAGYIQQPLEEVAERLGNLPTISKPYCSGSKRSIRPASMPAR